MSYYSLLSHFHLDNYFLLKISLLDFTSTRGAFIAFNVAFGEHDYRQITAIVIRQNSPGIVRVSLFVVTIHCLLVVPYCINSPRTRFIPIRPRSQEIIHLPQRAVVHVLYTYALQ